MASTITIYNQTTGEKKRIRSDHARYFLTSGVWGTSPPSSNKWDTLGGEDPILNQNKATKPGASPDAVGANLSVNAIQGLYGDGFLGYQESFNALLNAGVNETEAELLLRGKGPEADNSLEQWQNIVYTNLIDAVALGAKEAGFADPGSYAKGFVNFYRDTLDTLFNQTLQLTGQPPAPGSVRDPNNPTAMMELIRSGLHFLNQKWGWGDLTSLGGGSGGGGGGGGGINVRDRFDVDQLALKINEAYQSGLMKEAPNPHKMARAYVDQVASNPTKALDFQTWVRRQMEADPMWKMVYQNKPDGVSPEMYMGFYANRVLQVIGAGASDASKIVQSQAALASSPDALAGRLSLHENVQQSSGFLGQLEQRARSAREILGVM